MIFTDPFVIALGIALTVKYRREGKVVSTWAMGIATLVVLAGLYQRIT